MKILSEKTYLLELDNKIIQQSDEGRWYHLDRVFILKTIETKGESTGTNYKAISLNLAERIVAFVFQIFNQNYFYSKLEVYQATVLNSKDLQSEMEAEKPIMEKRKAQTVVIKNLFLEIIAEEVIFTGLKRPEETIDMNQLIEAASFVENYIQKHVKEHSIELDKDTFSAHPHLNHFDTIIAALRRLMMSGKIYGYEISERTSTVKVALNEQSEIVQHPSFINQNKLLQETVIPALKEKKDGFFYR